MKLRMYCKVDDCGELKNKLIIAEIIDGILTPESCDYKIIEYIRMMKFTGLMDRNRVEIYEGDVIRHHIGKYHEIGSIKFDIGSFWIMYYDEPAKKSISDLVKFNLDTDSDNIIMDDIEIIGKIAQIKIT